MLESPAGRGAPADERARRPPDARRYARAGVDVAAGERAVELMRASVASTRRPEVLGGLGGFGSAVAIPAGYREPVIVSSTDGVGTKTAIAAAMGRLDTIGIDLVAMCADDVACTGAEPLAFLDYIAIGQAGPGAGGGAGRRGSPRAAARRAARSSAARRRSTRGSWSPTSSTSRGSASGWGSGAGCSTGRRRGPATRSWGWRRPGCTRTATRWSGRSSRSTGSTSTRRTPALLRRVLGDAAAAGCSREPDDADATLGDVLLTPTRIYARDLLAIRAALEAAGHEVRGHRAHHRRRPAGQRAARAAGGARRAPRPGRLADAVGHAPAGRARRDRGRRSCARRSTAGSGWSLVVPAGGRRARPWSWRAGRGIPAWVVGEVVEAAAIGGRRYVEEGQRDGERQDRGRGLGDAGRTCGRWSRRRDAARWAARSCSSSRTARAPGSTGRRSRGSRRSWSPAATTRRSPRRSSRSAPDVVVLAGLPAADRARRCWRAFGGRILNVHPSLLPSFPGLHGARDALAAGVAVTGVTVHLVDATLDGGPIVAQEAVPVLPDDDEASLLERIHPVEHRLLPAAVAALLAGALTRRRRAPGARASTPRSPTPAMPVPRRALLSVSRQDRPRGPRPRPRRPRLGAGQHRRHRPGPARGRPARDRRRRRDRLPRDARRPRQDAPPAGPRRPPRGPPPRRPPRGAPRRRHRPVRPRRRQPLPVRRRRPQARHLLRRPRRGDRHRRAVDGPRRRQEPRLGGDRDLARPLRGRPRGPRRARRGPAGPPLRAGRGGVPPHRRLRRPDRCRAAGPHARGGRRRCPPEPGLPGVGRPVPADPHDLDGEGGHAPLRREPAPARRALPPHGPRAARRPRGRSRAGEPPLQGKALSLQQRARRVGRRRARAPDARPGRRHRASTPTRAARPSARPCSRPGSRRWPATPCRPSAASSRSPGPWTGRSPSGWSRSSSRSWSRRRSTTGAREVLATKPNLRLVVDPSLGAAAVAPRAARRSASAPSGPPAAASS